MSWFVWAAFCALFLIMEAISSMEEGGHILRQILLDKL